MPRGKKNTAPDPTRQLARLPRRANQTVVGGKRLLGLYLREDQEIIQPQLAIWLDEQSGMILGSELINPHRSPDAGTSEALASLVEALQHPERMPFLPNATLTNGPLSGRGGQAATPAFRPGLPAKILINDAALAQTAKAQLAPLGVLIEYQEELPLFEQAFQSLSQHLGANEGAEPPEPFAWDLPNEQLAPLYTAAASLWEHAPWEYLLDHPPVEVELGKHGPEPDVPTLYVSILGANGDISGAACYYSLEAFARALHKGEEMLTSNPNIDAAIEVLRQVGAPIEGIPLEELRMMVGGLLLDQEGLSPDQVQELMEDALVCFFNAQDESDPTYLEWMRTHKLKAPDEEGVPTFLKTSADGPPRQPNEREVQALTLALEALNQYFSQFGEQLDAGAEPGVPLVHTAHITVGTEQITVPVNFTPTEEMYQDTGEASDLEPDKPASLAARTTLYRFRVKLQGRKDVWRRIEMTGDQTLHDLHEAIQEAFAWDDEHLYAFFLSGKPWDESTEYDSPYSGGERSAAKHRLEHLPLKSGKQFLYIFDFGEELRHEITLEAILPGKAQRGLDYPRITERQGTAPPHDYGEEALEHEEDTEW